jgi:uncharacterized protein with HEPN domain
MRDKLIHAYFSIDTLKVWKVIKEDIPVLKPQIETVLMEYTRRGTRSGRPSS